MRRREREQRHGGFWDREVTGGEEGDVFVWFLDVFFLSTLMVGILHSAGQQSSLVLVVRRQAILALHRAE